MTTNIYRQKLVNAVLFFAKETSRLNMTKLSKLLNFFDFEHFKQTGYPAIGLEYYAFENGPVPKKFWLEVKDGIEPGDFEGKIAIVVKRHEFVSERKEIEFKARAGARLDLSVFSPREKQILENLAFVYKDVSGSQISKISHQAERPWITTRDTKGLNAPIDYLLAIDEQSKIDRDEAEENLREHFAILKAFDIEPVK